MEITGRLTANATVSTLRDERQVIHFTLAINDYYQPKGASEMKQFTQFIRCSYWRNTAIATRLLKGGIVEISGRLFTSAYVSKEGEPKAALNAHCNHIKVHSTNSKKWNSKEPPAIIPAPLPAAINNRAAIPQEEDDIPF